MSDQADTAGLTGNCSAEDSPAASGDADAACWRQAAQIRQDRPRWVVIWVARESLYRAYPKFGTRHAAAVSAESPDDLIAAMDQVERRARRQ